jgi:hypothetical protein
MDFRRSPGVLRQMELQKMILFFVGPILARMLSLAMVVTFCALIALVCVNQPLAWAAGEPVNRGEEAVMPLGPPSCSSLGMTRLDSSPKFGQICEPKGESSLQRIANCLTVGLEAVLTPENHGVACVAPNKGGEYLDSTGKDGSEQPKYPNPHKIDARAACAETQRASNPDKRLLPSSLIKELTQLAKDRIDPRGIRIIGGIYCDGLDLNGVNLSYSLILDRSIFNKDVEMKNARVNGDLSVDNAISYKSLVISRTTISGSLWGQVAFFKRLEIENSSIGGSVRLNGTIVASSLTIDNASIGGDLDVSASFFSNLEILRNSIKRVLDLGQSQARCSFDIRDNEIGNVLAIQLGFGEVEQVANDAGDAVVETDPESADPRAAVKHEHFRFKRVTDDANFGRPLTTFPKDPYDRYTEPASGTGAIIRGLKQCVSPRSIRQGAFVLVDNHIKSTLCIRSFNWPTDSQGHTLKGNIYLNGADIGGATWLNLTRLKKAGVVNESQKPEVATNGRTPELNIFNVTTGTLVLNFDLAAEDIALKVNGLHFKHIYASQEMCESALSLRAGKPRAQHSSAGQPPTFPPTLELPTAEQVATWINKNKFARTQQPFAEFVNVFENAGNSEVATDLRIRASNFALLASTCSLLPPLVWRKIGWCSGEGDANRNNDYGQIEVSSAHAAPWYQQVIRWMEKTLVTLFHFILGVLADYGYRPERIVWWVIGTVAFAWLFFRYVLKIVAFSVEGDPEKIRPVGLVFLFDRLLPAYRIREENYKIHHFFSISDKKDDHAEKKVDCISRKFAITESATKAGEWAELSLDILKFVGFVFAIFVVAAISKLVH